MGPTDLDSPGRPLRRRILALVGAFATAFLVSFGAQAAIAGTAYSSNGYYTVNGHQYVNFAIISTSTGSASASTWNQWSGGGTQVGWAGARGRLFTQDGYLSCEGSNTYNAAYGDPAIGYSCVRTQPYVWYSYGVSLAWNGSGYSSYYTYASPYQNSY